MSIYKKFTTLLLGMALLAPAGRAAPETATAGAGAATPSVAEVIDAVEQTYGTATSIRAEFVQVDRSKALGTEMSQRGKIALERPRKLRIDMGMPVSSAIVSDGKTMWIYTAKEKQVMEMPEVGEGTGMTVLLEDLGKLGELFNVTVVPEKVPGRPSITLQLVPKQPGAFKSLQLTLTKQKYVLQELVLVNQLDDVTEMSFTAVRMNQDIPDAEFKFAAPPGVKVVKTGAM